MAGKQIVLPSVNAEKVYVAILKEEGDGSNPTYDTPKYLEGVREIGRKLKVDSSPYYHEGRKYLDEITLSDIDFELSLTDLLDTDEAYILGHKIAEGGGIIRNENDTPPTLAILYKTNKANKNGQKVDQYDALYAVTFQDYDTDIKSKEGKSNFQDVKIKGNARPLKNGLWSYKVRTDSDGEGAADTIAKFFTEVVMPEEKAELLSKEVDSGVESKEKKKVVKVDKENK